MNFLFGREATNTHFPKIIRKVYEDVAVCYSAVKKWVSRIRGEEEDPRLSGLEKQRSGRPLLAVNPGNSAQAEELIRDDRRVTIDDIAQRFGITHKSAAKIVGKLGFAKVSARFVPRQLTDATSKPVSKPVWSFSSVKQMKLYLSV